MATGLIERWQALLDHPILRMELQRVRRRWWWPGRRLFLAYAVLLGGGLGCLATWLLDTREGVRLMTGLAGAPVLCLVTGPSRLLSVGLPWITPVFTASAIARERELGTLDLLRVTLLGERSIVLGKLAASLVRLWPGMVLLALFSPFHAAQGLLGMFLLSPPFSPAPFPREAEALWWTWVMMVGVVGLLRPWANLALHATVGLFASTWFRSSTLAIVATYGAIVLTQAILRVGETVLSSVLGVMLVKPSLSVSGTLLTMAATALAFTLIRFGGSILLVWGSVWRMERI